MTSTRLSSGKRSIVFYKFDKTWILPTHGKPPGGYTLHIEPVLLVEDGDADKLCEAVLKQLGEQPAVPEPSLERERLPVFVKAMNLKSRRAFHAGARAFQVTKSAEELSLEEWRKAPGSAFTGPPLWKRDFGPDEFAELAWFLVTHDSLAFPTQSGEEGGADARPKGKRSKH